MVYRGRLRLLAVLLGLSLVAAAACGDDDDATETGGDAPTAESDVRVGLVYDVGGRNDLGLNDAAYTGLSQARDELGVEIQELEPTSGGQDREELLRTLAEDGYQLIIGLGPSFADPLARVASDYPDTSFAIVDAVVDGPNVTSLVFAAEQGAYLVGAAAGFFTASNRIGFIGGAEDDGTRSLEAGFVAGVEKVKPEATVQTSYLPQPPDGAKAREAALALYGGGADVVFHAAGASGTGLFEAARDTRAAGTYVWSIGVDSDQGRSPLVDEAARATILTSMVKRVDTAVFDAVQAFVEDDLEPGPVVLTLVDGGLDYSTTGDHLTAEVQARIDELQQQIVDGEIEVPTTPG